MSVLSKSLLHAVENICNNPSATVNDLSLGGQLGVGPHLPNIDGATPLSFSPAVAIITHAPTMFNNIPNMNQILKSLVERHAKSITNIDFGYELDEGSAYILPDGQEVKVPTKNKRTAVSPNMTFAEIQGNLVWNFFRTWMSMISHPDTHASKLASLPISAITDPFVFSYFSMDMLFIQFDPTMLPENIIDAAFITTMYPKTTGQLGLKREIATIDVPERSIDFNGIVQHNSNVYNAAVKIATALQLHTASFDIAPPVADMIDDNVGSMGQESEMNSIMNEFSLI